MSENIEVHIANAYALEPGKVYVLEADRSGVSMEDARHIMEQLVSIGVNVLVVRTLGGKALRFVEVEPKEKSDV